MAGFVPAAVEVSDIQEDFCIKLNEYPILTKFSTSDEFKTPEFLAEFEKLVPGGGYFYFRIELGPDGNIIVTPSLSRLQSSIIYNYRSNPGFFSAYVSFQLKNSGILPSIVELILLGNQVGIALRVIARSKRDFSSSFFNFHKDQSIFTMLQYYNFSQPFVFGTEVLLGYKEHETLLPHQLLGVLPLPEKVGNLSNAFSTISAVNSELKDSGVDAVVLRGKYNNGDTMTFSDPLLRHATIKANEVFESNAIKISIPKRDQSSERNVHEDTVQVCSMREPTTPEMVDNRQAIAMFLFLDTENYTGYSREKFGEPIIIDPTPTREIKTINFNKDEFKGFVETLSSGEGCVVIRDLTITSRGGIKQKPYKRKQSNKKNKTNKKKKTIKKRRMSKKNKMNKRKTKRNKN
uniref:Uncharacterized protein n=1 Tax=viral metagenome TaxID=1070528 RepID=A0A6C0K3B6_9ZZZZ